MEVSQRMYKIFAPRGGGRTYQICKYAIENDCDIIVPTSLNVELVTKTIIFLCESSCGKWTYSGYRVDSRDVYVYTYEFTSRLSDYKQVLGSERCTVTVCR